MFNRYYCNAYRVRLRFDKDRDRKSSGTLSEAHKGTLARELTLFLPLQHVTQKVHDEVIP